MKPMRFHLRIALIRAALAVAWLPIDPSFLSAQPSGSIAPEAEEEFERLLEELNLSEESDQELLDLLDYYREHPISLHAATVEELARLPGISPQTARRVLEFVAAESPEDFDRFDDIKELEPSTLPTLRLYTTLSGKGVTDKGSQFGLSVRSRFVRDLQKRKGYKEPVFRIRLQRDPATGDSLGLDTIRLGSRYVGGSEGVLTRILIEHGSFSGGITFEKDPGERLLYTDTLGFSYENFELVDPALSATPEVRTGLGGFLSAHGRAELKPATIFLGDYTAEFGQGLLFGRSFAGRKGSAPTRDPYRSGGGLRSYRSGGEANYFRGIGVELRAGEWLPSWLEGGLLLSRRLLDAGIVNELAPDGGATQHVGSIGTDGYLRTRSEIRRNDRLTEEVVGIHARSRFGKGSLGITAYHGRYDPPVEERISNDAPISRWSLGSVDATFDFSAGRGFGELALSDRGGVAGIAGVALRLPRADVTVSGRYYGPTFFSPHGVAFGESPAAPNNEGGLYIGVRTRLFPRAFLSLYGDLYRFPEVNATIPFAVSGIDGMALFDYGVSRDLAIGVRLRLERRGDVASAADELGRDVKRSIDRTVAGGRFDVSWKPNRGSVEARFRLEEKIAVYSDLVSGANGFLTYFDFRWRPFSTLSLGSRLILFNAESSDVQLYESEQDLPGRLTLSPLSGEGGRFYTLAQWKATASLTLSARFSETWYVDRGAISAGTLQQIDGSVLDQVAVQMEWGM